MVAYSFKSMFVPAIEAGIKCQTVRADRRRHARKGEPIQLYTGMRTKQCRKIGPDPICTAVWPIEICTSHLAEDWIVAISICGIPLTRDEIEAFADADGFAPTVLGTSKSARVSMGAFWKANHPEGRWQGVVIKWEPGK